MTILRRFNSELSGSGFLCLTGVMNKTYMYIMSILRKIDSRFFFFPYIVVLTLLIFSQTGCNEEEECTVPRIDSLTFRDSLSQIDYLVPTRIITIHGANLNSLTAAYINQTSLNLLYMLVYEDSIIFRMPSIASNDAETELSDTLRIVKECGESMIRTTILSAPPVIYKISNEYAIAGDTVTLEGKYFTLLESVIFPDDLEGEILTGYSDTICQVVVPRGVLNEGQITLVSRSGAGYSATGIEYRDRSGLICNFDDVNNWDGFGGIVTSASDDHEIPQACGYFFLGEASAIAPGTEVIESTQLPLSFNLTLPYSGNLPPDYFAIKMEIFTKEPWEAGAYRIEIGKKDAGNDIEFAYQYDYEAWNDTIYDGTFSTPRWQTVKVPLDGFKMKGADNIYLQSYSQIRVINYMVFSFVNPSAEEGGTTIDKMGIAFDNIRLSQTRPDPE